MTALACPVERLGVAVRYLVQVQVNAFRMRQIGVPALRDRLVALGFSEVEAKRHVSLIVQTEC